MGPDCDDTKASLTNDCSCEIKCLLVQASQTNKSISGKTESNTDDDIDVSDCECEDIVIIDDSFKEIDAYCVYQTLKNTNGDLFKKTIGSFIADPNYNLKFRVGECSTTDEACTDGRNISNGEITIVFENTNMQSLVAAATILHEGIHAELYRFVQEVHNGNVDANDRKRLFDLYFFYKTYDDPKFAASNAQHAFMAENYVKPIAESLQQIDGNKYSLDHYMAFGWDGLRSSAYDGLLPDAKDSEYIRLQKIVKQNTSFNPENCD